MQFLERKNQSWEEVGVGSSCLSVWHISYWHQAQKIFHPPLLDRVLQKALRRSIFLREDVRDRIVRASHETEQTGWWILPSAVGKSGKRRWWCSEKALTLRFLDNMGAGRSKWKTPEVGAGRTVDNTYHFKPVINAHEELKVWRLKINVVIYQKKTTKYTWILMYWHCL